MLGTRIGTTNMMIQGQGGRCSAVTVTVGADVSGLQLAIADVLPEEKDIRVSAAGDALVLSGQVSDAIQAQRVVELAQHFVEVANVPVSNIPATDGKAGSLDTSSEKSQARVINMLTVAAPQQVMLEVKVAEVSKTLIDELGLTAQFASTHWTGEIGSLLKFGGGDKILHLKAQKSDQPVKILAEPSLLAISGQKASFTAGGKVFIPVPQATGNGGLSVLLQEETFGVKLSFTPTVLRDGVINLQVAPEVSQLSDSGASFSYGGREMRTLPIIDTRSATTTVQLRDGESFAIGGLMRNDMHGKVDALPGLGEIPVLGALFRSTSYRAEKTELVFVVTPHLVKPLPSTPVLPTASFGRTDTLNMITNVNMEGDKHDAKTSPPAEPVASQVTDPALDGSAAQK